MLVLVCMIHYNAAWFGINIERQDVIVNSQQQCNEIAIKKGKNFAGTGSVIAYDEQSESGKKQLAIRCGINRKDCIDMRTTQEN